MFHYYTSGDLFLLVHGSDAPDDASWGRYVDALGRVDRPRRFAKILVLTEGGSPSTPQRALLTDVTSKEDRTAVVSSAAMPRFAVSIIALMHRNIRSFAPSDFESATRFIELTAPERRAAIEHLETLRREGSLGLLRVLDETLATVRV